MKIVFKLMVVFLVQVTTVVFADKLRIAYDAAPTTADPYRGRGTPTGSMNAHIYEGLIARHGELLLATKYTWQAPTRLLVDLRQGVKFHDGTVFTARDVVYSTCRMMHKINGKNNLVTASLTPLKDVKAVGNHQVVFETVKPYPILIHLLKYIYIFPANLGIDVPQNIKYDGDGNCGIGAYATTAEVEKGYTSKGVGTGPFKLVSFTKDGKTKMIRHDNYWGKKSDWAELEISAVTNTGARMAGLLAGNYDMITGPSLEDMKSLEKNPKFHTASIPSWRPIFVMYNFADSAAGIKAPGNRNPIQDLRVRQAMSLAIDRDAIVNRLLGGVGTKAKQIGPEYMDGAETGLPELEYDKKKAQKLLVEAGYRNGFEIDLFLPVDRYPNIARVGQAIAQYWAQIGIKVNIEALPWSVFSKKRSAKKLGIWLYGWGHPQGFTQMIRFNYPKADKDLGIGSHNKYTNYKNSELDKWLQMWAVENNQAKADEYGRNAMKIVVEDLAAIPLYYKHLTWAFRDGLTFAPTPDGHTNAKYVTMK